MAASAFLVVCNTTLLYNLCGMRWDGAIIWGSLQTWGSDPGGDVDIETDW